MSEIIQLDQFRRAQPSEPTPIERVVAKLAPLSEDQQVEVYTRAESIVRARGGSSRKDRSKRWYKTAAKLRFWNDLRSLGQSAYGAFENAGLEDARPYKDLDRGSDLLNMVVAAALMLLLTPAPAAYALSEKRKLVKAYMWRFHELEQKKVERQLADDEEWLRVNARPRRRSH